MTKFENRNGLLWKMTHGFGNNISLVTDFQEKTIKLFFGLVEREEYEFNMTTSNFGEILHILKLRFSAQDY